MNNIFKALFFCLFSGLFTGLATSLMSCSDRSIQNTPDNGNISPMMSGTNDQGFEQATTTRKFEFPKDHAAHPKFQTEWWYVTGNLESKNQQRYGFQLTIFRRALSTDRPDIKSNWATNQIYMANFSVSDIHNNKFYSSERFSRDSMSLAGVQEQPFKVWLLDWEIGSKNQDFFPLMLKASDTKQENTKQKNASNKNETKDKFSLSLLLDSVKPPVLQGEKGLSKKSSKDGNASYYYSYSRLNATGSVSINDNTFSVDGDAWMDREWSTSALDETQNGWDWFSLQLSNNEEIMFYQLRNKNGEIDIASSGTYVSKNGTVTTLNHTQVKIDVLEHWTSPSGITYPAAWKLFIPHEKIDLTIKPHMSHQEINFSVRYWEGAVKIEGMVKSKKISGHGYVELAGYSEDK